LSFSPPLIIDRPEDNLGSEFISSTLVPVLRRAKERRQIIIVTHSANIAILSDAEQIVVLKSNSLLVNLAMGGGWAVNPPPGGYYDMWIDYVRYYH
jgi:predicted ATP-dependent endonuclease of OLD family